MYWNDTVNVVINIDIFADMALNKQINKLFADLNWEWHDVVCIRAVANYKLVNL